MNGIGAGALAALVLLPAVAAALLLVLGRRADRVAGPVAVGVAVVLVVLAVPCGLTGPELRVPFLGLVDGGWLGLAVDGLSAVMVATVAVVTAAVAVFAAADLPADAARARFFGFLLLFAAAMLVTVTATTLVALLLAWEVMGATSYALIAFHWSDPGKVSAGNTAFITTRAADLALYVAAGAAVAGTGGLLLVDLPAAREPWRDVLAAGVLVAALGKSAQLPFSAWLSAAMQGPSPVSALLHSATMVAAGGYLLLRLQPLLAATGWAAVAAAWAGALTALVLGAVAVAQRDLKQLLAASTAAQIGFVVLAAGVAATAGGTAQLVAHAAVKAALFVAAGGWLTALGTKQLAGLGGAARRYRELGAAAVVAALALAGVPPLSLWATKDAVLAGVAGPGLQVTALAAAALSAAYAGKVLVVVLGPPAPTDQLDVEEPGTRTVPVATLGPAVLLAAAAAALGALALPAVTHWFGRLVGATSEPQPNVAQLAGSGVLAVVVVAVVALRPRLVTVTEGTALAGWAGLARLLTPAPAIRLAHALAQADERVLDRAVTAVPAAVRHLARVAAHRGERDVDAAVHGSAVATIRLARRAADLDVADVDGAVRSVAAGLLRGGGLARRPQTGLLHQYYAMAATGLAALLVLLLVA